MAKMEAVVYFITSDMEAIRKIQQRFGMPEKMTVNGECPVVLDRDEDIEMLRKCEVLGFLQIRNKPIFNFF